MSISADEKKLNDLTDTFTKTYTDIVEHLKSVLQKRLELELDFLGEGAVPMHYVDDDGEDEKSLGDFIEDNSTQDTIDDNGDVDMFIRYIENSGLTDKEQVVILNKYGLNEERRVFKDKEIAELLDNISVSRVQQMLYKARVKVIKAGKKDGVEFNLLKGREKTSK